MADVDFVIESVAENLDIKKSVWAEVEHAAPKDAILSTNTSGLSPTALQSVLKKPERFVVAHFWNPAQLMPLVEVVEAEGADPAATLHDLKHITDQLLVRNPSYRCTRCGFGARTHHWQCPSCKEWGTIKPLLNYAVV